MWLNFCISFVWITVKNDVLYLSAISDRSAENLRTSCLDLERFLLVSILYLCILLNATSLTCFYLTARGDNGFPVYVHFIGEFDGLNVALFFFYLITRQIIVCCIFINVKNIILLNFK